MKTLTYTVHVERSDEGGFTVTAPALPGCVTEGETYEEAVEMAREAIQLYVESLIEAGEQALVETHPPRVLEIPVKIELAAFS